MYKNVFSPVYSSPDHCIPTENFFEKRVLRNYSISFNIFSEILREHFRHLVVVTFRFRAKRLVRRCYDIEHFFVQKYHSDDLDSGSKLRI